MTPDEEERGWEELRGRWSDEGAHRAWLDGFADLEGLARAGQRYRAHLAANAGDPVAARWLEEIVKRATVRGLASLPRTKPPPPVPGWAKGMAIVGLSAALVGALFWIVRQVLALATGR
jgi:hypothetical protein